MLLAPIAQERFRPIFESGKDRSNRRAECSWLMLLVNKFYKPGAEKDLQLIAMSALTV